MEFPICDNNSDPIDSFFAAILPIYFGGIVLGVK